MSFDPVLFYDLVFGWILLGLALMPVQLVVPAPYGRHNHGRFGPEIDHRPGWLLMEAPSLATMLLTYSLSVRQGVNVALLFVALWSLHYFNRSVVFALQRRGSRNKIPLVVVVSAILFNVVNAFINGYYFGRLSSYPVPALFLRPGFVLGALLFLGGAAVNVTADQVLIRLRSNSVADYKIPRHFLFRHVSCPNHLGELLEWGGFALAASSLPALAFFVWTAANIIPRAMHHHKWYREHFPSYPRDRKAVLPFCL